VQAGHGIFGNTQRLQFGQIEIHFDGRFRLGNLLENKFHTINDNLLNRLCDFFRRRNVADGPAGSCFPYSGIHLSLRILRQKRSEHIHGAAFHGVSRHEVLADNFSCHPLGGKNPDFPRLHIFVGNNALHPAPVIHMAVRINHGGHGTPGKMTVKEIQSGPGRFHGNQRIDNDVSRFPLDESDVGKIISPHLINAVTNLEKAMNGAAPRVTPQS